ncbi:DUF3892 domain-containing protein [Xanthomonas sp. WHRI 8393]|uniref:DUF3892 domain-containing protein n=1 Tax=Xanthomonas sp. WHRI 8393 TaxID=3161574 RepID=UPI0032E8A96E
MVNQNYYVSAISYNSDETHIAKLRIHKIIDGTSKFIPLEFEDVTRPKVIELIEKGSRFSTIIKKSDGGWSIGAPLEIVPVTTKYVKTRRDESTKDNLENLPSF